MINGDFIKIVLKDKELPTVIAFSSVNTPKGKFKPYRIVIEANVNIIFINDSGNNWYQKGIVGISENSKVAASKLVEYARELGNGKVFTFGTSMGAYGAILFAHLGHADGCLSFGVESELLAKGSRSERYMIDKSYMDYPDLIPILKDDVKTIVICSENDEIDLMSAYRMSNLNQVSIRTVQGIEHPGVQVYDKYNKVAKLIEDFCAYREIENIQSGDIMSKSKLIPLLYESFVYRTVNKDFKKSLEVLESVKEEIRDSSTYYLRLGECKYRLGDYVNAEVLWERSIALSSNQFEAQSKLGALLHKKGNLDTSIELLEKSVKINPWHAHAYHTLGKCYDDSGMPLKAELNLRKAVEINKGNKYFKRSLADFLLKDVQRKTNEFKDIYSSLLN